jgi:hypothetical protein
VQLPDGATVCPEQLSFCLLNWVGSVPVRVIVPTIRLAVPVLVTVNVCAPDELPTTTAPKFLLEGDTELPGAVPVPLNGTVTVGALDGIERSALRLPVDVGENTACTVQLPDGATVCPEQLSFCLPNWVGSVPVRVTVPITRLAVPVFVTVNVCAPDELPTFIEPKL